MATPDQIAEVRSNTHEPDASKGFSDLVVGELIDGNGVIGTSAIIWRKKAAIYADMVNMSEAGSSVALGDLQKKALEMAKLYEEVAGQSGRSAMRVIQRPSLREKLFNGYL